MQTKSFSWGIIALMLFLFFPVGIYMLIKKVTSEKFYMAKNGKALKVIGWALIGFAAMYLIMSISGELDTEYGAPTASEIITVEVLFLCLGALSLWKGGQYFTRGVKYNRYVAAVSASSSLSISQIAAAIPESYETAVSDLQAMLEDGYFQGAYLDLEHKKLVMRRSYQPHASDPYAMPSQNAGGYITKKCPNCGATSCLVEGCVCECEYCGSPL